MEDMMQSTESKDSYYYFIIALVTLQVPLLLFLFRHLDDNRLTSWRWTFQHVNIMWFFLWLAVGVTIAFVFSRKGIIRGRLPFLGGLSFFSAALFWGESEIIIDASRYFIQAKSLTEYGVGYYFREWGNELFAWTDLPLIPFIYGLMFKLFGESRLALQFLTTLFFSATVLLTYGLGKLLWDEEVGYNGALLLLAFPYLYTQVPLLLVDVPTMFFFLLALYLFTRALKEGGGFNISMAVCAIFFAFYAKFSTWVFLGCFLVTFFTSVFRTPSATVRRCAIVGLWSATLIGAAFYAKHDVFLEQIHFLVQYQKPGLGRWGEGYISTFFFQTHIFVTAAVVYSGYVALKRKEYTYLNIACFVLLMFFLGVKRIRYTLPLFPYLALLAAYGIAEIRNRRVREFLVGCAVSSSLVVALVAYLPFLEKMSAANIKEAGRFLNTLEVEEVEVIPLLYEDDIVNPIISIPLLDYFTDKKVTTSVFTFRVAPEKYLTSSLRFTWEYKLPALYSPGVAPSSARKAVAVLSSKADPVLPDPVLEKTRLFSRQKNFTQTTGVFLHQTKLSLNF
jgi:hypothetical protein